MAETQNVFVTRTQNRFLPIIQAFNDNLYKHMQMQGELNDKTIAFNRKVEGERFTGEVGKKLINATTLEDVNKIFGVAIAEGSSRGLNDQLPFIESIAKNQETAVGLKQGKREVETMSKIVLDNLGEKLIPWENGVASINTAWNQTSKKLGEDDYASKMKILSYMQSNILEEEQGLLYKGGNQWFASKSLKDKSGQFYNQEEAPIVSGSGGQILAEWKTGSKPLTPKLSEDYGKMIADMENRKAQIDLSYWAYGQKDEQAFATPYILKNPDGTKTTVRMTKGGGLVNAFDGTTVKADPKAQLVSLSDNSYKTIITNVEKNLSGVVKGLGSKITSGGTGWANPKSDSELFSFLEDQPTSYYSGSSLKKSTWEKALGDAQGNFSFGSSISLYQKMQELNRNVIEVDGTKRSQLTNEEKDAYDLMTVMLYDYQNSYAQTGGTPIVNITAEEYNASMTRIKKKPELEAKLEEVTPKEEDFLPGNPETKKKKIEGI